MRPRPTQTSYGNAPKDLSFDEKLAKIQKYLPGGLTEKILSQRERIEGERRHVTIMFVDMKGFTPLTEQLGPEETFSLMDQVYEIMIHKVHDYEGTVNELRGDGILALFGAPVALEDGPQRAIRASLAMHREMVKFSDKVKAEKALAPIKVRIGINTGPVVVGTLGNDLRVQFTAVGDTINMAARMEQLAEPGTTYVTEDTFRLSEGFFRFEALGEKQVKGKEKPMKVYQVIAPSTRRTRFEVTAGRGLTPLVARKREIEFLLDAFERAKSGRGNAISIVGEAGVGKSRILYEFGKAIANEDVTFLEGRCLSYGRGSAYHPLIEILKSNFDVGEDDGHSEIKEKISSGLKTLGVNEASALPYLLELLSVDESGIAKIPISPEAKKDRIIEALKTLVHKGSEIRPLVIAIEDLHWSDRSSQDALKALLDSIPAVRAMLIFTYRPASEQILPVKSFHNQLTLNRLSYRESHTMASHLLGTEKLHRDLEELVLARTEGVPLFIEELLKSLKDLQIIEMSQDEYRLRKGIDDVTIPSTIQDVIMARVDSLPEGPKEVLQAGSVIEREFGYDLLKGVVAHSEQELLSHLSVLKSSELLYERGIFPESTFIFKHALTRDVVYESILDRKKRELHKAIGDSIEELYKRNLDYHYGVLALHFFAGDDFEKSAEYSELARRAALKNGLVMDAIRCGKRTVAALERLPNSINVQKKIVDGRASTGIDMLWMSLQVEARELVAPVSDLALELDCKKQASKISTILGAFDFCIAEDFTTGFKRFNDALTHAESSGSVRSEVNPEYWLGYAHTMCCRFDEALHHLERFVEIISELSELWRVSIAKSLVGYLAYHFRRPDLACKACQDAILMVNESSDVFSRAYGHSCLGTSQWACGLFEEAKENLSSGLDLSKRVDLFFWCAMTSQNLAEICYDTGEYKRAREHYEDAIRFMQRIKWLPSWVNLNKIGLAKTKAASGEKVNDLESLYAYVNHNKLTLYEGSMRRHLGETLLEIGDEHFSEAEHLVPQAIEADQRNGVVSYLGRDYALYAELFKRKGDRVAAKEQLGKAIEIYKECGADGWVTKAEEELARMQ